MSDTKKADKTAKADKTETPEKSTLTPSFTEEEKTEFFKAFLGDKPFTGTQPIFGGKVNIGFRSLSTTETMEVYGLVRSHQIEGSVNNDTNYVTEIASMRLGLALTDIDGVPFLPELTKEAYPDYINRRADVVKGWPVFKSAGILEAFRKFEDKLIGLTAEIQTENFWKAVK